MRRKYNDKEKADPFPPHTHCKICAKMIEVGDGYKVSDFWDTFFVCNNCYDKVKDTCLSSSKSKSRAKRESGYF